MPLSGAKEMKATLKAIRAGGQNALRTAAFAGARHLRAAERRAVPRATGQSARKIVAKRHRGKPGEARTTVEVTRTGFYLKILEVGAKAHPIGVNAVHRGMDPISRKVTRREKGRRALALGKGFGAGHGLIVFRRAVQHPGVRARRWFSTTYERERPIILTKIAEAYAANLAKQAHKKGL